jgi:hypothetical protein
MTPIQWVIVILLFVVASAKQLFNSFVFKEKSFKSRSSFFVGGLQVDQ